jgi:hypothetical protein
MADSLISESDSYNKNIHDYPGYLFSDLSKFSKTNVTINAFSTEPVLQISLFFISSNMGALICNEEGSSIHEFSTMNRQDGHLQFDPKRSNLRSYAHGQLRLQQAKLAIA